MTVYRIDNPYRESYTFDGGLTTFTQAWSFSKDGERVGTCYNQSSALNKLGAGYDIETMTIIRELGQPYKFEYGTIAYNVAVYREGLTQNETV